MIEVNYISIYYSTVCERGKNLPTFRKNFNKALFQRKITNENVFFKRYVIQKFAVYL